MATGLPVITSRKSGAAELVVEREAGLVVPSRDVPGLAAQMRTLADAATRERMGMNARNAVLHLTPEAMTLALVLLYKELLEASAIRQKHDAERKLRVHHEAWTAKAKPPPEERTSASPSQESGSRTPAPAADAAKPPP
jgi:hypothetical protein